MRLILQLLNLFARGTALMLALVGAIAALGGLGGAFSDRLDTLTHLTPLWLVLGLAGAALGAAVARGGERKAIVAIGAAAVLASGGLMAPDLLARIAPKPKAVGTSTLKLVQFNIWARNDAPQKTLDWILAQNADVVMIEEAGGGSWPVIKGLSKAYPNYVSCPGVRYCDTWIFSRLPMVKGQTSPQDHMEKINTREDGTLRCAWATLRDPRGDFTVAATHFVWPIPAGPQQAQSRLLVSRMAPFDKSSLILTGDFNSTPWSFSLRRQDKALGLERRSRALASWPAGKFSRLAKAPFPFLPIDQVYAGKAWKTVRVERGPVLGSDHRPVVVTLAR